MKAFTDAIGLWPHCLGPGMIYIFYSQVKLVFMMFSCSTVFGSPVCQDSQQGYLILPIERQDFIIEHVSGY
jgi:hypothetical protein